MYRKQSPVGPCEDTSIPSTLRDLFPPAVGVGIDVPGFRNLVLYSSFSPFFPTHWFWLRKPLSELRRSNGSTCHYTKPSGASCVPCSHSGTYIGKDEAYHEDHVHQDSLQQSLKRSSPKLKATVMGGSLVEEHSGGG